MSNPLRKPNGTFVPGHPGMGGRPIGARSKLSETMLQLLAADVAENGAEVIAQVRREKPSVWLQCVCSLLPKQLQTERLSPLADLTDAELTLIEETLRAGRARVVSEPEPDDTKQPGA
jgi:hypothetical protein